MRNATFGFALLVAISFAARSFADEILNLDAKTNSGVTGLGNPVTCLGQHGHRKAARSRRRSAATAPTLVSRSERNAGHQFHGSQFAQRPDVWHNRASGLTAVPELTAFIVASVTSNTGFYNAFLAAGGAAPANDYQTGFNFDQGNNSNSPLSYLNVEGSKGNGETNLLSHG